MAGTNDVQLSPSNASPREEPNAAEDEVEAGNAVEELYMLSGIC